MNKALADILEFANAIIAWLIVIAGAFVGVAVGQGMGYPSVGGAIGALVGFVVAALFCGLLALIIDIRNQIKRTADLMQAAKE